MSSSPAFKTPENIANRALQHCGATAIVTLDDNDRNAAEVKRCYDGLRQAELRDNVWTFACKRAVLYPINTPLTGAQNGTTVQPTLYLRPAGWSATKQYPFGYIVEHDDTVWVNTAFLSINEEPGTSAAMNWDAYFGSMCVNPWLDPEDPDSSNFSQGYYVGDLVYNGEQVFVSLENTNTQPPLAPADWASDVYYSEGQVIVDTDGFEWRSFINNNLNLQPGVYGSWSSVPTYAIDAMVIGSDGVLYVALASNTNHDPANGASPTRWEALGAPGSWPLYQTGRTYALNEYVAGSDGNVYQSLQASNTGHEPVGSVFNPNMPASNWWIATGTRVPWIANFGAGGGNSAWLGIDADMDPINIQYPIGTGPTVQTQNKNVFFLPYGFLREAPQDPKAGSVSPLGAPSGRVYEDWEKDGQFILSMTPYPIVYRFVADVTQVSKMDPMFCEAFAARIGMEVCEALTQSAAKIGTIERHYKRSMDRAKLASGIEQGPTEPPEDDYITCRV